MKPWIRAVADWKFPVAWSVFFATLVYIAALLDADPVLLGLIAYMGCFMMIVVTMVSRTAEKVLDEYENPQPLLWEGD